MAVLKGLNNIDLMPRFRMRNINRDTNVKKFVQARDVCCQKCGGCGDESHHIIALCYGGLDHSSNCVLLCSSCHDSSPDSPYDFFKWIKNSVPYHHSSFPRVTRFVKSKIMKIIKCQTTLKNSECFSYNDLDYEFDLLLSNLLFGANRNYKNCWRYRHSQDIFEKDNLNDLFNLKEITDCVFGKLFDERELFIKNIRYKNGEINRSKAIMEINNLKDRCPEISNRKIAKCLGTTHKTIAKYIENGRK